MLEPVKLLTLPEVAKRLRKSEAQIRWMIQQRTAPPSAIIGGRRMFREPEVEAWIAEQFEKTQVAR
jgi:predicted DNA-binding transcriptional regulator AlpA